MNGRQLIAKAMTPVRDSWRMVLSAAINAMPASYWDELAATHGWLPGPSLLFHSFARVDLDEAKHLLIGESPFPRAASANGVAFWDGGVTNLWDGSGGFVKDINKATSLRNLLKACLFADGRLKQDEYGADFVRKSYSASDHVTTMAELFGNMFLEGVVPFNFVPVLMRHKYAAKWRHRRSLERKWEPFNHCLLSAIRKQGHRPAVVTFGRVAGMINETANAMGFNVITAVHPYNESFISDEAVVGWIGRLKILNRRT